VKIWGMGSLVLVECLSVMTNTLMIQSKFDMFQMVSSLATAWVTLIYNFSVEGCDGVLLFFLGVGGVQDIFFRSENDDILYF
jgi:hypothetical protein